MSIRFSAARGGTTPGFAYPLCPSAPLDAVNDNGRRAGRPGALATRARDDASIADPLVLPEALRHFAVHGLSSALKARAKAEAASAAGDELACVRWLAICRQFDKRMAAAATRRLRPGA